MNLDDLLALPKSGVVILFKQKQVLVTYTTSMGAHLESLYQQFGGQRGITLKVMSAGADLETLKLHTEYYRDFYSRAGSVLLQAHLRKTVQYKVRIAPAIGFKFMQVELVNARGDSKFVGRFRTSREAKDFVDMYYGKDNTFQFPVYALNSDTKEFLLDMQKKMLEIK
jgi:hypothetical protein